MKTAALALVLASLAAGLGGYALLDPDEGRNAEVAREMAASNDYFLPRLNTLPYVDKPVLSFAASALSIELLGVTELAARLPSLLFTLGTIVLAWVFARRVSGPCEAWLAAIATAASPLTIGFARTVIFDAALTFWITLALAAFYLAIDPAEGGGKKETGWLPPVGWAALAFGVLTKGPIALALPLMVILPYAAWRRSWRPVADPVGILLFLAIILPWVRFMSDRVPGYLHYVFATETVARLTTPALQRTGPWWYFLPILLVGALPWSATAWARFRPAAIPARSPRHLMVFLLLWILVPLVFFSLSQSKRPQYVLPLIPPIALLTAITWNQRSAWFGGAALGGLGGVILVGYRWVPAMIRNVDPGVAAEIPRTALLLGLACLAGAGAAIALRHRRELAVMALCLPAVALPFVSGGLMRMVGNDRSSRDLAAAIRPLLTDAAQVVGVNAFPLSLPFYLERPLVLSTSDGRELTSNYLAAGLESWRAVPSSPLRAAGWWKEAVLECDRPRFFVIRSSDTEARAFLSERLPHLAESRKYAVYGPCGNPELALQTGGRADGRTGNGLPGQRAAARGSDRAARPSDRLTVRPSE